VNLAVLIEGVERSARRAWRSDAVRFAVRTLYYLAVIVAVAMTQGRGHDVPPPFVYQGF